jgi:putative RecB family exonuclease
MRGVSPSGLGRFRSCELRFFFLDVERWISPPTSDSARGDLVHRTIESLYGLPSADRTREGAETLLTATARTLLEDPVHAPFINDADLAAAARAALDGLFSLEEPAAVDVEEDGSERWVRGQVGATTVWGRIDRLDRQPVTRVIDYKTGKAPAREHRAAKLNQLYIYAAALQGADDPVLADEVELLYLPDATRIRRPVTAAVLARVTADVDATWSTISDRSERQQWNAIRSPLCSRCEVRRGCPAVTRDAPIPGSPAANDRLTAAGLNRRSSPAAQRAGVASDATPQVP